MASQMQPQKYYSSTTTQLALEALTLCQKKDQTEKHCNSCMISSSVLVSPSSDNASLIGDDYIGTESCIDLDDHYHHHQQSSSSPSGGVVVADGGNDSGVCSKSRGKREQQRHNNRKTKREFPPPIPSIARAEYQLFPHMPWVLKRYYTADGRLILKEEKVRNQEYFRAHRSNGRLTLHLVPLGDDDDEIDIAGDQNPIEETIIDEEEEKEETQINIFDTNIEENIIDVDDDDDDDEDDDDGVDSTLSEDNNPVIDDSMVKQLSSMAMAAETPSALSLSLSPTPTATATAMDNGINAAAANGLMCLDYSSVRSSPTCFLGLPVPAIRPVHS